MTHQLYEPFPGVKLWIDASENEMEYLKTEGRYEWRKVNYIRQHLKAGQTFVDVGAHIGYFTMLAASIVGQHGLVTAWEPDDQNITWLWRSIEANKFEDIVSLYHMLAGKDHGLRMLYRGASSGQHSVLPVSYYQFPIWQSRLDTNCKAADILKIDVEAAELEVLQGATDLLKYTRHILLDLHPQLGANPESIQAILQEAGFNLYDIRNDFMPLRIIPGDLVELLAVKQ